jgi:hypothetical protein
MANDKLLDKIKNKNKWVVTGLTILGFVVLFFIWWFLLNVVIMPLINIAPEWGAQVTAAAIDAPDFLVNLFGNDIFASWNSLIVFIAVFFMLLFALADMISSFSTFKKGTSWILAFGLGIIGVFTGAMNMIIVKLFGGVATNLLIGWTGIREMRQQSKKKKNAMAGVKAIGDNLRTAYQVNKEISKSAQEIGEEESKENK